MRADAQRNYDRLLTEARQAFIVHGTDVPLEDIARHAGVGIGTLYRHFPDRWTLINAAFDQELDDLTQLADELSTADDPAVALFSWLHTMAIHSIMYRGMSAAIIEHSAERMESCRARLRGAGGTLLQRAQQAGTVRADIRVGDLLKMTHALAMAAEKNPQELGLFDRLMSMTMDGVRARQEAPTTSS